MKLFPVCVNMDKPCLRLPAFPQALPLNSRLDSKAKVVELNQPSLGLHVNFWYTHLSLYLPTSLSLYLSTCLSTYLSIYVSINLYLSINQPIYLYTSIPPKQRSPKQQENRGILGCRKSGKGAPVVSILQSESPKTQQSTDWAGFRA